MGFVRTSSTLALAAVMLAACSAKPPGAGGAASSSSTAAASSSSSEDKLGPEIPASEIPAVRAGYWESTDTEPGQKPHVERTCESGKRQSFSLGKECAHLSAHRTLLGAFVMDAACGSGPTGMAMHVEVRGDFQNSYTVDAITKLKLGKDQPEQVMTTHSEGRYLGPCPAGVKPQD